METSTKTIVNYSGQYNSTYKFVFLNNLEKEAEQLFGKNWEAEDDVSQIKSLIEHTSKNSRHYSFLVDEYRDEDDIIIELNEKSLLCEKLEEQIKKQKDCISYILNTLYSLEEVYDFDETSTGKQIGEVVNKLQNTFLKPNKP